MKNTIFLLAFFALATTACLNDAPLPQAQGATSKNGLSLAKETKPEWEYQNLRLIPVLASEQLMADNSNIQNLKTLAEAMTSPGFRIMERKQFGRGGDEWYHGLTVQNKTQDTVLLLSGDVVKGGNQDRVIAQHEVIMPMSVRNIEVFCVEAGRSSYYDPAAPAAEKEVAAFKGYYNVASPQVRRAVQKAGNQQEVWDAVSRVTKANNAESSTKAYTALDNESDQKLQRDAYLQHLGSAFAHQPNAVGVVAVCGDRVLGIDIFGNPGLFQRQFPALLHGYVAEAATLSATIPAENEQVEQAFEKVARLAVPHAKSTDEAGKFTWGNAWVHLFGK